MAIEMPLVRLAHRMDTNTQWDKCDPVLAKGELGYCQFSDGTVLHKCGDGVSAWKALPWASGGPGSGGGEGGGGGGSVPPPDLSDYYTRQEADSATAIAINTALNANLETILTEKMEPTVRKVVDEAMEGSVTDLVNTVVDTTVDAAVSTAVDEALKTAVGEAITEAVEILRPDINGATADMEAKIALALQSSISMIEGAAATAQAVVDSGVIRSEAVLALADGLHGQMLEILATTTKTELRMTQLELAMQGTNHKVSGQAVENNTLTAMQDQYVTRMALFLVEKFGYDPRFPTSPPTTPETPPEGGA